MKTRNERALAKLPISQWLENETGENSYQASGNFRGVRVIPPVASRIRLAGKCCKSNFPGHVIYLPAPQGSLALKLQLIAPDSVKRKINENLDSYRWFGMP